MIDPTKSPNGILGVWNREARRLEWWRLDEAGAFLGIPGTGRRQSAVGLPPAEIESLTGQGRGWVRFTPIDNYEPEWAVMDDVQLEKLVKALNSVLGTALRTKIYIFLREWKFYRAQVKVMYAERDAMKAAVKTAAPTSSLPEADDSKKK